MAVSSVALWHRKRVEISNKCSGSELFDKPLHAKRSGEYSVYNSLVILLCLLKRSKLRFKSFSDRKNVPTEKPKIKATSCFKLA